MRSRNIRLRIDSQLEDVFLVGLAVNKICTQIPVNDVVAYQMEVCVVEGVNNAIKHAYKGETGHEVEVLISLTVDRVLFEIRDYGSSMPPSLLEGRKLEFDPGDYDTLPENGMGLYIMCDLMDEVEYRTEEDGRNVLRMGKRFEHVNIAAEAEA